MVKVHMSSTKIHKLDIHDDHNFVAHQALRSKHFNEKALN